MNYIQDNIRLTKENILLRRRLETANRLLEGWLRQLPRKVVQVKGVQVTYKQPRGTRPSLLKD